MPVHAELCEDGHVIYFKLDDPWTMDELFKGFTQSIAFRDDILKIDPNRRVHTLIDLLDTRQAPPGVMQGRNLPALTHPISGEIVFAVQSEYPRRIGEAMLKIMHTEGHFFETLDAAWQYLRDLIRKSPTA